MAKINGPAVPVTPTAPKAVPKSPTPNIPKGAGDFTKPAPNPFTPKQNVRPATPADRGNSSNRSVGGGIASNLFNNAKSYVTNLGRSVRDVPTAFGTALDTQGAMAAGTNGMPSGTAPIKNLATQIGQAGGSLFGKKDTSRSSQFYGPDKMYIDSKSDGGFYLNNPAKLNGK